MKKLLVLLGILAAFSFVACNKEAGDDSRKWESAVEDAEAITDNGDGTFSATIKSAYSGTGVIVNINQDGSSISAGKKVKVVFDYETDSWSDELLYPKFKISLLKTVSSYWDKDNNDCTKGRESYSNYRDGDANKGTVDIELECDAEASMLLVQFNAFKWPGDTTNDSVKITVKSVEIL